MTGAKRGRHQEKGQIDVEKGIEEKNLRKERRRDGENE